MFDENLVNVIVGGKDPPCGSAQLSLSFWLTRGHGLLPVALSYFRAGGRVARSSLITRSLSRSYSALSDDMSMEKRYFTSALTSLS